MLKIPNEFVEMLSKVSLRVGFISYPSNKVIIYFWV